MRTLGEELLHRTEYLRSLIEDSEAETKSICRWVNRNVRAHNRHMFQGHPCDIVQGWARRAAQAKATWAKPRGWKP